MKLSKLKILLLASLSLLVSAAFLSCSNSSGSGGGSDSAAGNIIAKATDEGIEVTAKKLSGNSRVDIYKMIGDKKKNTGHMVQMYMTNNNTEDSVTVVDKYVNVGERYTYYLTLNGNWEESKTVQASAGKGELQVSYEVTSDGVKIDFGDLDPVQNYFTISRFDLEDSNNYIESIDFTSPYNKSSYTDRFVEKEKKYEYQASIIVEGDHSGNKPMLIAYSRPVTVNVTSENALGELDLQNAPKATYNSSTRTMSFTTLPEFTPDNLDREYMGIGFYIGGSGIGEWFTRMGDTFQVKNSAQSGKIDGYCIYYCKDGESVFSYKYNQKNNTKLNGMPAITK